MPPEIHGTEAGKTKLFRNFSTPPQQAGHRPHVGLCSALHAYGETHSNPGHGPYIGLCPRLRMPMQVRQGLRRVCGGRHTTRTAAVIQVFHGRHTHVRRPSHASRTRERHCRNVVRAAATRAQEWFSAGKWRSGSRLHRALFYKNRLLSAPAQSRNNSCGSGRPRLPFSKVQGRAWQQYR